jgi:hypothetical protein
MGAQCTWGPKDGACSSSSRLLCPACAERKDEVKGKERRVWDGARRTGAGYTRAWRDEEDEKGLQRYGESAARFCWTVRYCPMKSYPFIRIYGRQQFPCQYPHFSLLALSNTEYNINIIDDSPPFCCKLGARSFTMQGEEMVGPSGRPADLSCQHFQATRQASRPVSVIPCGEENEYDKPSFPAIT